MTTYRNYRTLTAGEIDELARLYPVTPNRLLARQYGISVDALTDYVARPRGWQKNQKAIQIGSRGGRTLTEKETQWIIRHYQHTKNTDIMEKYGIGFELKESYFNEAIKNCRNIEVESHQPTLFG